MSPTTALAPPPFLAGYRLAQRLGSGTRSDVYLGVAAQGATAVALKVFRPDVELAAVQTEIAALERVRNPHVVRFDGTVNSDEGAPVLVLSCVPGGSVAALLRQRGTIEIGEAITLLAPVCEALSVLHRAGVAHGRLGASTVHLGPIGEPVLLGFGHTHVANNTASAVVEKTHLAFAADLTALGALVRYVLGYVRGGDSDRKVQELVSRTEGTDSLYSAEFAAELQSRLFETADPLAVRSAVGPRVDPAIPSRFGVIQRPATVHELVGSRDSSSVPGPRASRIARMLEKNPVDSARDRLLGWVRGVRRPFWVAGLAVTAALILAISLVPQSSGSRATAESRAVPIASTAPRHSAVPLNPAPALTALLRIRTECIQTRSVVCLNSAEEESSAALAKDSAVIRAIQSGSQVPSSSAIDSTSPVVIQRLGDSALVALSGDHAADPTIPGHRRASALLIKGPNGWRIRSFMTNGPTQP
jgi:tRNA A-37 threonylcarbamoyl transferase component Bud32